jgi:hypothetical protein
MRPEILRNEKSSIYGQASFLISNPYIPVSATALSRWATDDSLGFETLQARAFGTLSVIRWHHGGPIAVDTRFHFSIPENFCRADLASLPAGRAGYLVYCKNDRLVHLLPAAPTDLLNVCATFRPLAEHAQSGYNFLEMVQPGPADLREQFVIAQLEELRRRGLLIPESSLKEFYREHGELEVNPKIHL